jgi:hypothetical protein
VLIENSLLILASFQIGITDKQRNLIVGIQVLPKHIGQLIDVITQCYPLRLTLESRNNRVAIAHIGVDEVAQTGNTGILIEETGTSAAFCISRL